MVTLAQAPLAISFSWPWGSARDRAARTTYRDAFRVCWNYYRVTSECSIAIWDAEFRADFEHLSRTVVELPAGQFAPVLLKELESFSYNRRSCIEERLGRVFSTTRPYAIYPISAYLRRERRLQLNPDCRPKEPKVQCI